MDVFQHTRPHFWNIRASKTHDRLLFNYRRVWLVSIFLLLVVSLFPMSILMGINFKLAHEAISNENRLRTLRITSNTRRTITYFLEERLDALRFIVQGRKPESLTSNEELRYLLLNLKMGFGGFVDLGLIDQSGMQINYAGPFDLQGKSYKDQDWFTKCAEECSYISDVFLGYRNRPHMIIAQRWPVGEDGSFYVLRSTLDITKFITIISSLDLTAGSDAFICNHEGLLQTPSRHFGEVLAKITLPIPEYSPHSQIMEVEDHKGNPILVGYAFIENSPYILMLVKRSEEVMKGWYSLRDEMIWFFFGSSVVILIVVYGMATFIMNRVYDADQGRLKAMERLESSSRLISVGRLATGVAHEINNPLAVISENAGLLKDIFTFKKEYKEDPQLMELIDAVLESVERSGAITKQLLGFARQFEPSISPLHLKEVMSEVLSFLGKEPLYRNISVHMDIPEDLPVIYSDRRSLQQIFLNLINNAIQAMNSGGLLDITARKIQGDRVSISIQDNGRGISPENLKKIFEPFFTTRGLNGGTGLGLSITYGLVRKLNGDITVHSELGVGTMFVITLPFRFEGDIKDESLAR
ncbi:MAG: ATP-binding protein [Deltaproteobacteria bacterium]|nr:ATP-binding protein [Deltaproteobacteria bacterium]